MFKNLSLKPTGKSTIFLIFLVILFYSMMNQTMPSELVLDLKFGYSANRAFQLLEMMGPEVRSDYLRCLLLFELPYMVAYTLLLMQLFNFLWKESGIRLVYLGVFVLDFLENIIILRMVSAFPDYPSFLGFMASFFTTAKWILVAVVLMLIFVGVLKKIFSNEKQGLL